MKSAERPLLAVSGSQNLEFLVIWMAALPPKADIDLIVF